MPTKVEYKKSVFRDLKTIGIPEAGRIISRLEEILKENPHRGFPLKGKFTGLFKIKIGNYRVIYTKTQKGVLILRIRHRREVYKWK